MNEALLERLKNFLHRNDKSTLVGIPASREEIAQRKGLFKVGLTM